MVEGDSLSQTHILFSVHLRTCLKNNPLNNNES